MLLAVKSPANEVAKRLTTAQKLVLSDNPHGSVAALFADCANCATDGLIGDAGGPAWDADAFGRIAEHVQPRLHAAVYEVVTWAEEILRAPTTPGCASRGCAARSSRRPPPTSAASSPGSSPRLPDRGGRRPAAGRGPLPEGGRPRLDKLAENAGRDASRWPWSTGYRTPTPGAGRPDPRGQVGEAATRDPLADRGAPGSASSRRQLAPRCQCPSAAS